MCTVQVAVWSIPFKLHTHKFSLDQGVAMLEYLENYYGVHYSLTKEGKRSDPMQRVIRHFDHEKLWTFPPSPGPYPNPNLDQ